LGAPSRGVDKYLCVRSAFVRITHLAFSVEDKSMSTFVAVGHNDPYKAEEIRLMLRKMKKKGRSRDAENQRLVRVDGPS
jgi:hypothetical protein